MELKWNETYGIFVQVYIQSQMSSRCPQENRLDGEIDYLWNLIQFSKRSYNKLKQSVHCEVGLKVKNSDGRDTGALQHKVWKPGRLQLAKNDDNEAYEQQQTKFWDPGRHELKIPDQVVMFSFYFRSLMQEHQLSSQGTKG